MFFLIKLKKNQLFLTGFVFLLISLTFIFSIFALEVSLNGYQSSQVYNYEDANFNQSSVIITGQMYGKPSNENYQQYFSNIYSDLLERYPSTWWETYSFYGEYLTVKFLDSNISSTVHVLIVPEYDFYVLTDEKVDAVLIYPSIPQLSNETELEVKLDNSSAYLTLTGNYNDNIRIIQSINQRENILVVSEGSKFAIDRDVSSYQLYLKLKYQDYSAINRFNPPSFARSLVLPLEKFMKSRNQDPSFAFSFTYDEDLFDEGILQFQYIIVIFYAGLVFPLYSSILFSTGVFAKYLFEKQRKEKRIYQMRGFSLNLYSVQNTLLFLFTIILSNGISLLVTNFILKIGIFKIYYSGYFRLSVLIEIVLTIVFLTAQHISFVSERLYQFETTPKETDTIGAISPTLFLLTCSAILSIFSSFLSISISFMIAIIVIILSIILILSTGYVFKKSFIPILFQRARKTRNKRIFLAAARMRLYKDRTSQSFSSIFVIIIVIIIFISVPAGIISTVEYSRYYAIGGNMQIKSYEPLQQDNISYIAQNLGFKGKVVRSLTINSIPGIEYVNSIQLISINKSGLEIISKFLEIDLGNLQGWDTDNSIILDKTYIDQGGQDNFIIQGYWFDNQSEYTKNLKISTLLKDLPLTTKSTSYGEPTNTGGWTAIISESALSKLVQNSNITSINYRYHFIGEVSMKDKLGDVQKKFPDLSFELVPTPMEINNEFHLSDLTRGLLLSTISMVLLYYGVMGVVSINEGKKRFKMLTILHLDKKASSEIGIISTFLPTFIALLIGTLVGFIISSQLLFIIRSLGFRYAVISHFRLFSLNYEIFRELAMITIILVVLISIHYRIQIQKYSLNREKDVV